jgi:hypothetical protein
MYKGIILVLLLIGCCPKKPETPKKVNTETVSDVVSVMAGSCYRYPNVHKQDVHMKVIKTYDKGGFFAEFIVQKTIFTDIHEFTEGARHLKEIDCYMFEDLKSISKPSEVQ